jgi:glycine/D-amino acid oxidase-like deaminating enzyme
MSTADVVVIGAGVIGSATALELSRRGRRVVCVDAGPAVGAGSTSSSSAIIRFHYSTFDAVLTSWEAAAMWDDLPGHLGAVDPDGMVRFVPTGCLVLDFPGTNRPRVLAMLADVGIPFEELTADDIRRRWPSLDVGDYWPPRPVDDPTFADDAHGELGGYYTPDAGFIDDPMRAAGNFMYAARQLGATLRLNTRVTEIRQQGGRVVGVTLADGEHLDAPVVVNVGGPFSAGINRMAGVADEMRIGHRPLRSEVHVASCPDGFRISDGSATLVTDVNLGTYFRPQIGDTILVGGTEPDCDELEWVDDPGSYNDLPTVEHFERSMYRVARRLPSLGIPHRPLGLAALYDASDDWVPIYDRSSLEGFFMACGTSGNQFKNAPLAGVFMAELVDAAERGVDHDTDPVQWTGPRTGRTIDIGAFSRLRERAATTGSVLG